jgi:chemotaxis protein MotB
MAEPEKQDIIIVRRYEVEEDQPKGGVWKIAHADFMTAMMAFFLVMWLISVADKETRTSVANYFNPVQLAESTPDRKGLQDPQNNSPESGDEAKKAAPSDGAGEGKGGAAPQAQKPRYKEGSLFQDPYAVLAKLAAEVEQDRPEDTSAADVTFGDNLQPGMNGGEAYRDPFDPLYWQVVPSGTPRTKAPGAPGTTSPVPREGTIDALAGSSLVPSKTPEDKGRVEASPQVIDVAPSQFTSIKEAASMPPNSQDFQLKAEIANAVQSGSRPGPAPHIEVSRTGEGILISVTDEIDFSMFAVGSAEPQPKVVRAMEKIAKVISARPGRIIIRGHTDGRPFKSETYDNWRLSTARAHMASYMLVRGGVDETRIERVEGHADRSHKNAADPKAAENRRIEILLRERPS